MTEILSQLPESFPVLACFGVGILVLMTLYAVAEHYEHRRNKE